MSRQCRLVVRGAALPRLTNEFTPLVVLMERFVSDTVEQSVIVLNVIVINVYLYLFMYDANRNIWTKVRR